MPESLDLETNKDNKIGLDNNSGLQEPEFRYLAIGRVVRAHGVRGELSVAVLTDFPERFETTEWVYLGNEFEAEPYRLEKHRWHKQNVLLTLAEVNDRTEAEQLTGLLVQVPVEDAVPLPEGGSYLGFIFAHAPSPAQTEAALREAHSKLNIVVAPLWRAALA